MSISAVIVAAGLSERLKAKERKPFLKLGRRSVLETAICNFEKNVKIKNVVVVVHKDDLVRVRRLVRHFKKVNSVIPGGARRSDSVKRGIEALLPGEKIVLIHDAARPLVSSALIERVIRETEKYGAAIPVVKVSSTVKKIKGSFIERTIDRRRLFLAQTPQGFKVELLKKAFDNKKGMFLDVTDDACLLETCGRRVRAVPGEVSNIKITTRQDLKLARRLISKD